MVVTGSGIILQVSIRKNAGGVKDCLIKMPKNPAFFPETLWENKVRIVGKNLAFPGCLC